LDAEVLLAAIFVPAIFGGNQEDEEKASVGRQGYYCAHSAHFDRGHKGYHV
tara:strand:- start:1906 stop:2058 length:153 start_codon:yes stop_codon:yes gene_type:complete